MAKTAGDIRSSKWRGDIYTVNGVRKEYYELPDERKKAVRILTDKTSKAMYSNLKDKEVTLNTDKKEIKVYFTKKATEHVARDAMMVLSGKYMSKKTMVNIDKILAKSEYVRTPNILAKARNDGKTLFF